MGLATARALAQAGRDVVVCEQFELGHERGSSHGSSRIVRLSYPDERWVRLAQESFPLWRELEPESGRAPARPPRHARPRRLGAEPRRARRVRGAVRGARRGSDRAPVRIRAGSGRPRPLPGGRRHRPRGPSRRGARGGGCRRPRAVRERLRVRSVDEDGDGVTAGGVRARVAVVTAGAWAPALVGVDATPTVETVSYFDLGRPVPSVIDTTTGTRSGYALHSPGGSLKAGLHQIGTAGGPDEPGVPDRELAARTAAWVERRFLGVGPAEADGDLPLHDPRERRVPARAAWPDRRRLPLQRPRLQVRAGGRPAARRARARGALAEEVALLGDRDVAPVPGPAEVDASDHRGGDPADLPHHELGGAGELVGDRDLRRVQLVAEAVADAAEVEQRRQARRRRARRRSCPGGTAARTSR